MLIILFGGLKLYEVIDNKVPDYFKDENIPKGYVQKDGFSHDGMDWEDYYYYQYNAMPTLSKEYKKVDNLNIWVIKEDVLHFQDVWRGDDEPQVDFLKISVKVIILSDLSRKVCKFFTRVRFFSCILLSITMIMMETKWITF